MSNCEKKLDALIDALGFSVEVVTSVVPVDGLLVKGHLSVDYKLTKKTDNKAMLYQVIDRYENGEISFDVMISKVKIVEGEL